MSEGEIPVVESTRTVEDKENSPGLLSPKSHLKSQSIQLLFSLRKDLKIIGKHNPKPVKELHSTIASSTKAKIKIRRPTSTMMTTRRKHQNLIKSKLEDSSAPNLKTVPRRRSTAAVVAALKSSKVSGGSSVPSSKSAATATTSNNLSFANLEKLSQRMQSHVTASKGKLSPPIDPGQQEPSVPVLLPQPPPLLPLATTKTSIVTQQDPPACTSTITSTASITPPVRTKVKFDNISKLLNGFNRLVPGSNPPNNTNTIKSCEAAPTNSETDKGINSETIAEMAPTAENERRLCFLTDEETQKDHHEKILADLPIEESIDVGEAFPCDELEPSRMISSPPPPVDPVSIPDTLHNSPCQQSGIDEVSNPTAMALGNSESFNNDRAEESGRSIGVEGEDFDFGMTIHSPRSVQTPLSQTEQVSYFQENEINQEQSLFITEEDMDATETEAMSEEFSVNIEIDNVVSQFIDQSPYSLEQVIEIDLIQDVDPEEEMEFANLNTGSVHTVETVTNDKDNVPLSDNELRTDIPQPQPTPPPPATEDNGDADVVLIEVVNRKRPIQKPQESPVPPKNKKLVIINKEVAKVRDHTDTGADQNPTPKSKLSKPVMKPVPGVSNNGKSVPKPKGPDCKTLNRTDNLRKSHPSPRDAPGIDLNKITVVKNNNNCKTTVIPKAQSGPPKPTGQSQTSHQKAGRTMPPSQIVFIPPARSNPARQVLPSGQILPPGWTIQRTQIIQQQRPTHQPVNQGRKIIQASRRLVAPNVDPLAQVKTPTTQPQQTLNSAQHQKIQKLHQLQKVQKSIQLQKIPNSVQLQKVQRSDQLRKVQNLAQIQKIQKSAQFQKVPNQSQPQKVQNSAQLQKIQKSAQFQPVQNRSEVQKIHNPSHVQKVRKPSEDSDDDVKIISIHRRKKLSIPGGQDLPFKESSLSPLPFQMNANVSYVGPKSGPPTKKNSLPSSSSAESTTRLENNLHDATVSRHQSVPVHRVLNKSGCSVSPISVQAQAVTERQAEAARARELNQPSISTEVDLIDSELLWSISLKDLGLTNLDIESPDPVPVKCLSLPLDKTNSLCENCGCLFDESVTEHVCKWLCDLCGQFFHGGKSIFVDHRLLCDGNNPKHKIADKTNDFLNYHDLQIMVISAEDEKLIGEVGQKMNTEIPPTPDGIDTPRQIPTIVKLKSPTSDEDKTPTYSQTLKPLKPLTSTSERVKTSRGKEKVPTKSRRKRSRRDKEDDDYTDSDTDDEEYMDEIYRSSSESPSKRPARKRKPPRRYLEETSTAGLEKSKKETPSPNANSNHPKRTIPTLDASESSTASSSSSSEDDEFSDFENEHSESISGDENPAVSRKGFTSKKNRQRSSRAFAELNGIIKSYRCEVCYKKFRTEILMANHLFTHASQASFDCDRCNLSFQRPMELHRHVIANHRDVHEPKIRK